MKSRDEIELRKLLEEGLPLSEIEISQEPDPSVPESEGIARWYDVERVTTGDTVAEQQIIDRWILKVIGEKIGCEVKRIRVTNEQGYCELWYKRKAV